MTQTAAQSAANLDPRTLAAIHSLELRARMIVEGLMTGMHRSPFQGVSVEFAQHRQYTPGDDIRHLDWKVYGRTDKLYLKQYQKETNLDLVILVDASGSMGYSSGLSASGAGPDKQPWRKFDHAASLAAAMSYMALKQQDRVGLLVFSEKIVNGTRTSSTSEHWRAVLDTLSNTTPMVTTSDAAVKQAGGGPTPEDPTSRATNMARAFDEVLAKLTQRSLIVLISDLFDSPEALENSLARIRHRRHDLIILQTLDHAEIEFPFRDSSEFIGLESEGRLALDPAAIRDAYLEAFNEHQNKVKEVGRRFNFDHLVLDTSQQLGAPLSHFLARRAAMIGKG